MVYTTFVEEKWILFYKKDGPLTSYIRVRCLVDGPITKDYFIENHKLWVCSVFYIDRVISNQKMSVKQNKKHKCFQMRIYRGPVTK